MADNLSRQYLKAMGIDCWQHRDAQANPAVVHPNPAASVEGTSGAASVQPSVQAPVQGIRIAEWPAASFDKLLGSSRVTMLNSAANSQMLLVLEQQLTSPAEDLLSAMLKAIKIDRLAQSVGTISYNADSDSIDQVCLNIKPSIVVLMAMLSDRPNISELDAHRRDLHRFSWLNVPVAMTLHPQVLLDDPQCKRPAWEDLKRVKAFLDG